VGLSPRVVTGGRSNTTDRTAAGEREQGRRPLRGGHASPVPVLRWRGGRRGRAGRRGTARRRSASCSSQPAGGLRGDNTGCEVGAAGRSPCRRSSAAATVTARSSRRRSRMRSTGRWSCRPTSQPVEPRRGDGAPDGPLPAVPVAVQARGRPPAQRPRGPDRRPVPGTATASRRCTPADHPHTHRRRRSDCAMTNGAAGCSGHCL